MAYHPDRRTFLQGAGVLGASAAMGTIAPAQASQPERTDDTRFTLAIIPDTQYLFDDDRGDSAPLSATLRYIVDNRARHNIVFTAHLGDIVENAARHELVQAGEVFEILDDHRVPYSVLAGNHDIDSRTDDQRGPSAYLDVFGPHRFKRLSTFGGATPDGYNTYHRFRAAGQDWLLLALDWRPSDRTLTWVKSVLREHPRVPAILTTHEAVFADATGGAILSDHGRRLWEGLIKEHDQIFLCVNGHFWPPGRTVLRNNAGHDMQLHITNYQDRYYGGSGMLRLYEFDLARNTIDVETFSPWILGQDPDRRNVLEQREIELTDAGNRFSIELDFKDRFGGFAPVPPRQPRPASQLLIPGTVAYWRFDQGKPDGTPVPDGGQIPDLSGRGNHLTRVTLGDSGPEALQWNGSHHDDQPAHASLRFDGGKQPARGAYLRTLDSAPINGATFRDGYTIEAFVKLPADVRDTNHAWMSIIARMGTGNDAGKTGGDPSEPLATLSLSDGIALQWAVFTLNRDDITTNWGHEMRADQWFHVAVVNNGRFSTLYVDGAELLRNPAHATIGLATSNEPWFIGAYHYDRIIEQGFYGWLGDIRIVDRALPVHKFMFSRR